MSTTSHRPELDLLRRQVADLARELAERDRVLHDQTRHLQVAQALAHLGSWNWDVASGEVEWSDELYRIFGYEPRSREITFDSFVSAVLPDDHDRVLASIDDALAGAAPYDLECRIVHPDGEVRTIHCCGEVMRDGGGQPLRMSGTALDITDRKQTELALQQREAHFRALIEHSSDVITVLNLDGTIRFESPSVERLLGYAQHELNGRSAFEFVHHEDLPAVTEKFQLLIQRPGTPQLAEFRFRHKDGSWRNFEGIGRVIRDPDGRYSMIVNSRDITERKRAEAMLRASQERLQQALRASGTGLWEWNTETNDVVFSEEWKRQLGYEPAEISDSFEAWTMLLHPEDRDAAIAYVQDYVSSREGDYRQEFRLKHKDGGYRWIEARASFVTEAGGRRIRLLGSHADITDRKRMEESVRESEEWYRTLVELSPSGVFVFSEGRTVYVNHTGALLMGAKDAQEILDRPTFEFIHPHYHQEVRENVKRLLSGGMSVHSAERIYLKMDGTPIPVQVEAARITWNGQPAILGLFSDITERKRAEEALRASEELFSKAFRSSPDPMALVELDSGRWLDVNDTFVAGLGYPRESVVGQSGDEVGLWLTPDDRVRFIERLKREGSIRNFEAVFRTTHGERRDCLVSAELIEYHGKSCMVTLSKDITERRQGEQALWKSRQAIRALHDISSAQGQSFKERVEALLQLGCRFFDLPIGMETFVRGEALEVGQVNAPGMAFHPGMRVSLSKTYCSEALRQSGPVCFAHAGVSPEWQHHPAYAALRLESYIGTVINGQERTYGTLCFASVAPRNTAFTDSERDFIQLMARWLGSELDRQSALDALRQSEERYRTLYDETPSMYFTVDGTGIIRSVNQYGAQYLGYRVEDLVGKSVAAIFFEEDRARIYAQMEAFFRHPEGVAQWEFRKVRSDGAVLWVRELARVLQSRVGESLVLIVCEDITERKQAEKALADLNATLEQQIYDRTQALRQSEERFRQFFDNAPNVTALKDHHGRYVYTNRQFDKVFGLSAGIPIGKTDEELFSPEQAARFQSHDQQVLRNGRGQEFEEVTQQEDGPHTSIVVKFPVTDDSGHLSALGIIATDITERKRTQEQLRLYQEIFTHSIDGIAVIDPQGRYLLQNGAHERILGYTTDELTGKTPAIHLGDESFADVAGALAATGTYRGEVESRTRSGAVLTLDLTAFAVKDAEGQPICYVGIKRDITERNCAQTALRTSEERLRLAMEAADLGSWDVNVQTGEAVWSRRHALMQGYEPDPSPVSIQLWKDRIHPDDVNRVMMEVERAKEKQGLFSVEHRTVWGDGGEERWLSLYGRFFYDETGIPVRFSGVSIDITERNRAQAALRESEARFQQFAESVGSAFWIADLVPDGETLVYANSAFTRIWGIAREEWNQSVSRWFESIHPDDRMRVEAGRTRFISGGLKAEFDCEYRIVDRDGRIRWISDRRVKMAGWGHRVAGIAEDVTDHRQQLALMAQTEAVGKVGGWEIDFLTNHLWWSDETYRLHDTTPELYSPTVDTAVNFYTPESRPVITEALQKGVEQGEAWDLELELITAKGRRIAVRAAGKVDVVNGRAVRAYGTFQDITERKRAAEALRRAHDELEHKVMERTAELQASEERYARATAIGKVGVWELDVAKGQYYGDANLKALFGYGCDELSTDPFVWLGLVHPDDQPLAMENWERLQSGATDACHYELRMVTKDGSIVWTDVRCHSVHDQTGRLTHLIGATVDITERKQAERALRESEERFAKAFRTSPNPIGITEAATGRCIEVNDACLELFGFRREEVIGNTTLMLGIWPNLEDRVRVIERLKAGQPVRNMEFALKAKSGVVRYLLASADLAELNGTLCVVTVANDITDRKQAEEALRISEERFAKAFRASPHPVVISELDSGRVVDANDAACQLFGYRKEEVVGHTSLQIGVWHSVEERARYLELLRRQGAIRNVEVTLRSKDGDVRQCLLSSELIELNGKQCSVTVGDDITDRKRAESTLRSSEERLRSIFEHAGTGIAFADATGQYIQCNAAYCAIVGYTEEELRGTTFQQLLHPEDAAHNLELVERLVGNAIPSFEAENRYVHKHGHAVLVHKFVTALRGDDGRLTHFIALVTDISERKQAEVELQRSHTFLRQVIDTDPDLIFAKDREGRFAMANKAVADWYGTTVEDLIGKSDADFNTNAEEVAFFRQSDLEVINSGRDRFIPEERITDAGGRTRWLQTVKRPIFDDQGQVHLVLGAATDITERKRMEEILLQRERDLSAALEERERISQDLHDGILQSLYAIGLGLEACKPLIRKQQDQVAEKFMATLDQAIGQLNQVMTEVRNFIAGLESQVMQGGDFSTALRTMVETMSISCSARCRVKIDDSAARRLSTEQALHIINIVREGVSNALRHSRAKQITVSLRDLIRSDRLAVTDDGIGFNTRSVQGVGHGLVNMAARAQKVRGLFAIQSKPDKGTRISLDLPKDTPYAHN